MNILGLGGLLGDAACAVLVDGELRAAVEEEKINHAPRTGASVRIESLKARYWSARFDGARRLIE